MASSVQSRLQFFASLNGSQNSLTTHATPSAGARTPGANSSANSRTSLQHSSQSLSARSMGDLSSSHKEDDGKFLTVKERIARYGSGSGPSAGFGMSRQVGSMSNVNAAGPLGEIKMRLSAASRSQHGSQNDVSRSGPGSAPASQEQLTESARRPSTGAAESSYRRRLSASRPAPYPSVGSSGSRHGSQQDLRSGKQPQDEETVVSKPGPTSLADRMAAYKNATTGSAPVDKEVSLPNVSPASASAAVAPKTVQSAGAGAQQPQQQKFGVSNKCAACNKTVYLMEQVTIDNNIFHKTCLKCTHCKQTLKMGNLASMNGQYYCKPHFKQLFKLKGNYAEGFGLEDHKKNWVNGQGGNESA